MTRGIGLAVVLAVGAASPFVSMGPAVAHSGDAIAVCCAWNSQLADGDLTYRIRGGTAHDQQVLRDAVEAWDTAVTGLTLTETSGKPDVDVQFKPGGGPIQGHAVRQFERGATAWFIRAAKVTVSGSFLGLANSDTTLRIITEQEFGHALGIDHANFAGDVMSPDLADAVEGISTCDMEAVRQANAWKLIDDATTPAPPPVDHVHC